MSVREQDAPCSQPIEVGRLRLRVPFYTPDPVVEIVHSDEQHVRSLVAADRTAHVEADEESQGQGRSTYHINTFLRSGADLSHSCQESPTLIFRTVIAVA